MDRHAFVVALVLFTGCGKDADSPTLAAQQTSPAAQPIRFDPYSDVGYGGLTERPFSGETERKTFDGVLKGSWLRQQSGRTLGNLTKVTLLDPMRLVVGDQSLPLLGETKEMEHSLLENSGKQVRLTGHLTRCIEDGRGVQNPQAGFYGAIPAHVVQFLIVSECEVVLTGAE